MRSHTTRIQQMERLVRGPRKRPECPALRQTRELMERLGIEPIDDDWQLPPGCDDPIGAILRSVVPQTPGT